MKLVWLGYFLAVVGLADIAWDSYSGQSFIPNAVWSAWPSGFPLDVQQALVAAGAGIVGISLLRGKL
jgi:hypothetical protein